MSTSSEEYVLYKNRPDWRDVKPDLFENDNVGVINIAYSQSFKDCFGYLRAVLRSGELSERVFALTADCIIENPSCYTTWLLRRKLLQHLNKDIHQELSFMVSQIEDNPKNYQVWYHRQKLIEWLGEPDGELSFIERTLEQDAKNYHAWQYRQWLLKTFNIWEDELTFCEKKLDEDCRNNSAWNQRYLVVKCTTGFTESILRREIDYTLGKLEQVNLNESAWNYLQGILDHATEGQKREVLDKLSSYRANTTLPNVFLYSTLLTLLQTLNKIEEASEVASVLVKEDVLRKEYWMMRKQLLVK